MARLPGFDPLEILRRNDSAAEVYHENSKVWRLPGASGISAEAMAAMSHGFKSYPNSPTIALPPALDVTQSLGTAILQRRSSRKFTDASIPIGMLGTILFYAYGQRDGGPFRLVPSGGGLYPLEIYLVVLLGADPAPGIYHYDVRHHALESVPHRGNVEDIRRTIFVAETSATASAFIVVSAVTGRSRIKYGERAYRFALLEAGHIMQNAALVCTSFNVGFCPIGGFVDDEVHTLLEIDGVDEVALYLGALGQSSWQ